MVRHQSTEADESGRLGKWLDTAAGWAMANVLFDKTPSYPPAGSLREVLFLLVWLKRQTIERERMAVLAQGLASKDNLEHLSKAYSKFENAFLPWLKDATMVTDKKMLEALKKETAKGHILFKPMEDPRTSMRAKMQQLSAPDELRSSLAEGVKKRKGLRR